MVLFTILGALCYLAALACLLSTAAVAYQRAVWKDVAGFVRQRQQVKVAVGFLAAVVLGKIFLFLGIHH
jgi:hypothetical protein